MVIYTCVSRRNIFLLDLEPISYPEQCLCMGEDGIDSGEIDNRNP
jgi:hypothetical protein